MHVVWQTTSSSLRASASKNVILLCFTISKSNFIIIPYHFTIPPTSQNSIFIKILFFNLSLLFLSNRYFFQTRRDSIFLGLSIVFFFSSVSLNLQHKPQTQSNTNHQTHAVLVSLPQPQPSPSTVFVFLSHTHKHKPSNLLR